jgi:hypothetical protein
MMSLLQSGRPLKRWRYVGVFSEELMVCAAIVYVGPARQSFWALYRRDADELRERTRMLPRESALSLHRGSAPVQDDDDDASEPGRLRIRDAGVELDLSLVEESGFRAHCPHGRGEIWTRKQAGIAARGTLALDGGGVNDPPTRSERAVWIDGDPREVPPVRFREDLRRISTDDGSELRFHAEAERSHSSNLLIVKSDYRAPFGAFSGSLPGGVAVARGLGVVEHHRALW